VKPSRRGHMPANVLTVSLRLHISGDVAVHRAHGFTEASMEYGSHPSTFCEVQRRRRPLLYNASGDSTFKRSSRRLSLLCHSTGMYIKKNLSLAAIGKSIKPYSECRFLEHRLWHSHLLAHVQASAGAHNMGLCSCCFQHAVRGAHPFSRILLSKCRCQCTKSLFTFSTHKCSCTTQGKGLGNN